MSSIFTKLIQGDLPCYKIYEDERVFSFLALDQINLGHCLVVPKNEVDHFYDMAQEDYNAVFEASQLVSRAIKKTTDCTRVGLAVQGFEVPHAHVHLVPLWGADEFSFSRGKQRTPDEMAEIQQKIVSELNG